MNLSEMKRALMAGDIQLTKSLGQNFLHDGNQLRRIVAAADLRPDDKVLEIGPGLGPLTELLATQAGQVLALEKDQRLAEFTRARLAGMSNLTLLHCDALDYLRQEPRDWTDWKLVANLPYSVASPLLVELTQEGKGPSRMVATLQLEVARRLSARTNDDDYGILTLLLQLDYAAGDWFRIPGSCFFPEPDVDSACVNLQRRPAPLLPQELRQRYARIVKRGFSQRRKMFRKLLRQDWPVESLDRAFAELNLSHQIRAEAVSLPQFVELTKLLSA
jgi:16S rRNA (adenine1518-N6/adenine1519-N6)-dimethyltransferase